MSSDERMTRDVSVTFRLAPVIVSRVELLAAHSGHTRSEWLRLAVALADSTMTLAAIEAQPEQTPDALQVREQAATVLAEVIDALHPKPIPVAPVPTLN
jgi:hypothetical protein